MHSLKQQQPHDSSALASFTLPPQNPFLINSDLHQSDEKCKYIGFKLLAAFTSVSLSEFIISNTLFYRIFSNLYEKSSKLQDKKVWINRQVKHLTKSMIRYNMIVFGSKVILDDHYSQTFKKNETYYQSNSSLHYKIGAMTGFIGYVLSVPITEFQNLKAMKNITFNFPISNQPSNNVNRRVVILREYFSMDSLRRMLNNFNFLSLAGAVVFRTVYFGGYQKIKSKYQGPLNEYVIAPIVCSSLSLIVSPLDQIKYLQLTSHKGRSFYDILTEKGSKMWNLSPQKIYTSIIKQSLTMTLFVGGQNFCRFLIGKKNFSQ